MAVERRRGSEREAEQHRVASAPGSAASPAKRVADRVFWGYVGVAFLALLFQGAQTYRFGRSVARARSCIAHQDGTCVSRELEVQGSIRETDPHLELVAASLSLLLRRPIGQAQATANRFEAAQAAGSAATPADLRADVLLLRSDLAIENGDFERARESAEAARALLGETELTTLRLRRIEAAEGELSANNVKQVEALRQSFEKLFDAAAAGNRTLVDVHQPLCSDWMSRVADANARRQLGLALQAAGRANLVRYAEPNLGSYRGASSEPPTPPSRTSSYDSAYGSGTFEERTQRYQARLERYEKEQAAIRERESRRTSEASATKQAALDQAKEALAAAIAALSASPAPFESPRPAPPVVRSFSE